MRQRACKTGHNSIFHPANCLLLATYTLARYFREGKPIAGLTNLSFSSLWVQITTMMTHFLKNTFRIFRRNAGNTFINLTGLSIGLAAGILIMLFVFNELSFDRFHKHGHEIYRVNMVFVNQDGTFPSYTIPAAVGASLASGFPEIQSFTRLTQPQGGFFSLNDKIFEVDEISYADSSIFSNFSFELLTGDPKKALKDIYQVVLTKSTARAIFGDQNPIGKILKLNNKDNYVVNGIVADPPSNSSIRFSALLSFSSLYQDKSLYMDWNGGNQYITYIRMVKESSINSLESNLTPFLEENINRRIRESGGQYSLRFEPLYDIYLHPLFDDGSGGSLSNIRIFSAIALLILIIACFNFTSLSTAKAIRRSRETGIRKVSGASRGMLVRQFLGEALVMSFASLMLALLLIELVQPWYNAVTGIPLSLYNSGNAGFIPAVFLLVLFTGIAAGAYPAFYLASFNPVAVLKGGSGSVRAAGLIPKILVVFQFAISAGLINCLLVMFNQLNYVRNFDPGFRSGDVLALYLPSEASSKKHSIIGNELLSLPGVKSWTAVSEPPGAGSTSNGYFPEGYQDAVLINVLDVDSGFINTMGLKLLSGRNFTSGSTADSQSFMVNETYARRFGVSATTSHYIRREGKHPVIGIVKDFHFSSLHSPVEPLILTMNPWEGYTYILIQIDESQSVSIGQLIEKRWQILFPDEPFICTPLDIVISDNYTSEKSFARLFTGFTILALVIACLGLYGLSAVILQQRRRELGIRRILGADPYRLTFRVSSGFTLLVLIGNIIAAFPVWVIMKAWLSGFSYTVPLSVITFAETALFTILLSWLTILWQSIRTSRLNPVEVIRYE
ncbi:MAG: ABC transporter permease [Lentimicrobium sp.]